MNPITEDPPVRSDRRRHRRRFKPLGTPFAAGVVFLAACGPNNPGTTTPIGAPSSFAPVQKVVRGDGRIARCNTVHSSTLPAQMIERLNLDVGPDTAVISCALQATENGVIRVLPAQVRGTATALSGNIRELNFHEVTEQETVAYVASFTIDARVGIRFDVTIVDPQTGASYAVEFEQTKL